MLDHFAYDSLIFWADSLDSLVTKLQASGVHHLIRQWGLGQAAMYALVLDLPGNGIAVQVRSHHLTVAKAILFDECSKS